MLNALPEVGMTTDSPSADAKPEAVPAAICMETGLVEVRQPLPKLGHEAFVADGLETNATPVPAPETVAVTAVRV
jgi:hypothetical protein